MSLVSEALKKAEREAAARAARERGLPPPLEAPRQPYRAPRPGRPAARRLFLFTALAILAGLVLVVVLHREPESAGAPARVKEAAAPESTDTGLAEGAPAAEPPAAESAPAAMGTPAMESRREPPAAAPSALATPDAGPGEPRPRPSARPPGTAPEYVRAVDLADGSKLRLGGIAYSETAPFAYLNGKLLRVGEATAGFTLTRIERDLVVVRGAAGELVIRLKPR